MTPKDLTQIRSALKTIILANGSTMATDPGGVEAANEALLGCLDSVLAVARGLGRPKANETTEADFRANVERQCAAQPSGAAHFVDFLTALVDEGAAVFRAAKTDEAAADFARCVAVRCEGEPLDVEAFRSALAKMPQSENVRAIAYLGADELRISPRKTLLALSAPNRVMTVSIGRIEGYPVLKIRWTHARGKGGLNLVSQLGGEVVAAATLAVETEAPIVETIEPVIETPAVEVETTPEICETVEPEPTETAPVAIPKPKRASKPANDVCTKAKRPKARLTATEAARKNARKFGYTYRKAA